MSDFNSMLESVGINLEDSSLTTPHNWNGFHPSTPQETVVQAETTEEPEETPEAGVTTASLSEDDIAEILTDNGYDPYDENNEDPDVSDSADNEEDLEAEFAALQEALSPEEREVILAAHQTVDARDSLVTGEIELRVDSDGELATYNRDESLSREAAVHGNPHIGVFDPASVTSLHIDVGAIATETPTTPEEAADISASPRVRRARRMVEEHLQEEARSTAIPLNSPTLLIDNTTSRFSGAEWYNEIQKARIILAGLGGIGSWVSIQLARMAPEALYLYDDDTVETVNMAGQLYSRDDIGKAKVNAMEDMIMKYTSMQRVFALKEKFEGSTEAGDIMICGFDNMKARHTFYDSWFNHVHCKPEEERCKCLYLDGIMKCLIDYQYINILVNFAL